MLHRITQLIKVKIKKYREKSADEHRKALILLIFGTVMLLNLIAVIFPYIPFYYFNSIFNNSTQLENPNYDLKYKACYRYIPSSITPPPISVFKWHNTGLITLWFDDGNISQFTTIAPLLKKEGLTGALSITLSFICKPYFMNWEQLSFLQNQGWESVSHGATSTCNVAYYNQKNIEKEMIESKRIIEQHGLRADIFVMPCGYTSNDIAHYFIGQNTPIFETIQKYYQANRTSDRSKINPLPVTDPYNLYAFAISKTTSDKEIQNYINMAVAQKGWAIFIFYSVDNSDRLFSISVPQFKRILAMIKASGLPVVLPSQALGVSHK